MLALLLAGLALASILPSSSRVTFSELLFVAVVAAVAAFGIAPLILTTRPRLARPVMWLGAFLLTGALSIVWAAGNGVEILWWGRRFFPMAAFGAAVLGSNRYAVGAGRHSEAMRLYAVMSAFAVLVIGYGLLGPVIQGGGLGDYRLLGMQGMRRFGGGYFSSFVLAGLFPFIVTQRRGTLLFARRLVWIAVVVSAVGLLVSFTRSYWLATAAALLVELYLLWSRRMGLSAGRLLALAAAGVIVVAAVSVAVPSLPGFLVERLLGVFDRGLDESALDRLYELRGIWTSAVETPFLILLGHGLGATFTFYSVNPFSWGTLGWMVNDYSHNYFAYLFFGTGIVGMGLFLTFWAALLRYLSRALTFMKADYRSRDPSLVLVGIVGIAVSVMVASVFAPPLMSYQWAFYIGLLVGCGIGLVRSRPNCYGAECGTSSSAGGSKHG